jgi:arylsulfatase A-like enzyme
MKPLSTLLVLVAGLVLVSRPAAAAGLAGSKPNIILVITDDQGYPPVAALGHPLLQTPNLDKLHATSLRFDRFLVSPTCSPTRSAIMTGRHDLKNGITHTILERERMTLDAVTLPQVLKTAGYSTGIFGKWHLGDEEPYQPHNRGFDEAFIHGAGGIGQAYECSCADAPGNSYYGPVIRHNGTFVKTDGYCTDMFFTAALGWIKAKKDADAPFFAYISTNAPHGPYNAPAQNAERFTKLGLPKDAAGYFGMIENIDENMGRLLGKLEEWKLFDDTVVIFMSDNGTVAPGGGGGRAAARQANPPTEFYNAGMKGRKGSPDEGGVRVPFFVRWDGRITPGRDITTIAAHLDVLPTLAALAGADVPAGQVEGRSLLPLIEDPQAAWPDRYLFTHVARWPVGDEPNDHQYEKFSVRNQRYRLVGAELFDMQADPGQTKNVAAEHPDVVKAMRAAYDTFWKEARPLMVNEGVPMSPTKPFHELYRKQEQAGGIPKWQPPAL